MPDDQSSLSGLAKSAHDAGYIQRLINPRFDLIEKHFQHKVPQSLRNLYNNHAELVRTSIYIYVQNKLSEDAIYVQLYEPIDENSLKCYFEREDYIEIATCGAGQIFLINPTLDDPEVCLYNYEETSDNFFPLGVTLSKFITAPRRYEDEGTDQRG